MKNADTDYIDTIEDAQTEFERGMTTRQKRARHEHRREEKRLRSQARENKYISRAYQW